MSTANSCIIPLKIIFLPLQWAWSTICVIVGIALVVLWLLAVLSIFPFFVATVFLFIEPLIKGIQGGGSPIYLILVILAYVIAIPTMILHDRDGIYAFGTDAWNNFEEPFPGTHKWWVLFKKGQLKVLKGGS